MKIAKTALVAFALLAAPHGAIAGGAGAAIETPPVYVPPAAPVSSGPASSAGGAQWVLLGVAAAGLAVALSSR